jgi:meiotic recombination protein DMC1
MSKQDEREESQEQSGEEVENTWNDVSKLQDLGINAGDIKKLKDAGCYTVESLIMRTKKSLCNIKGLSEAKVDKILDAANKIYVSHV